MKTKINNEKAVVMDDALDVLFELAQAKKRKEVENG